MPIISFPDLLQWQPVWANDGFENEIMFSHLPTADYSELANIHLETLPGAWERKC